MTEWERHLIAWGTGRDPKTGRFVGKRMVIASPRQPYRWTAYEILMSSLSGSTVLSSEDQAKRLFENVRRIVTDR